MIRSALQDPRHDNSLTWEQVLARPDIVGGELELQSFATEVVRGPIKSIALEDDGMVRIEFLWSASMPHPMRGSRNPWKYDGPGKYYYVSATSDLTKPSNVGDGRVAFLIPGVFDMCVIFPKGGSQLNRAKVEGIPPGL